jgi:hypothetical protein
MNGRRERCYAFILLFDGCEFNVLNDVLDLMKKKLKEEY